MTVGNLVPTAIYKCRWPAVNPSIFGSDLGALTSVRAVNLLELWSSK